MKYRVTYVINSDAPDVIAFQTPEKPGEYSPLRRALITSDGNQQIESLTVETIGHPSSPEER